MLMRIARKSSLQALRESKAMGLSITYLEDEILYEEKPDETRKILKDAGKKSERLKIGGKVIKKGTVAYTKK